MARVRSDRLHAADRELRTVRWAFGLAGNRRMNWPGGSYDPETHTLPSTADQCERARPAASRRRGVDMNFVQDAAGAEQRGSGAGAGADAPAVRRQRRGREAARRP